MSDQEWTVVLFATSSHAIRAEKILKDVELTPRLVPVPRHLSSDCGLCVRLPRHQRQQLDMAIDKSRFIYESVHDI